MSLKWNYNPFTDSLDITEPFSLSASSTNFSGSDCSGADGSTNRTLVTNGVTMIVVDNQLLHPLEDYTVTNKVVTFFNEIWNSQKGTIWN